MAELRESGDGEPIALVVAFRPRSCLIDEDLPIDFMASIKGARVGLWISEGGLLGDAGYMPAACSMLALPAAAYVVRDIPGKRTNILCSVQGVIRQVVADMLEPSDALKTPCRSSRLTAHLPCSALMNVHKYAAP
jgi:hypothetical protein